MVVNDLQRQERERGYWAMNRPTTGSVIPTSNTEQGPGTRGPGLDWVGDVGLGSSPVGFGGLPIPPTPVFFGERNKSGVTGWDHVYECINHIYSLYINVASRRCGSKWYRWSRRRTTRKGISGPQPTSPRPAH